MPLHIRIFLSSPGDVNEERRLAQQVVEQLPDRPMFRDRVTLRLVAWDKPGAGTPMLATMTPQEAIDQGLTKPSECDIVVVVLWARMGTPLPEEYKKPDGSRYLSGTEWEFWNALDAAKRTGRPHLLVYRRTENVPLHDKVPDYKQRLEQKHRVDDFFAGFVDRDGSFKRAYKTYEKPGDFQKLFESDLEELVLGLLKEQSPEDVKKRLDDYLYSEYAQFSQNSLTTSLNKLRSNSLPDVLAGNWVIYSELDERLRLLPGSSKRFLKEVASHYGLSSDEEGESGIRFKHF